MLALTVSNNRFFINGSAVTFPTDIQLLRQILGDCRHLAAKANHIYTWDELGLLAYAKDGTAVEHILVCYEIEKYAFSPKQVFTGEFSINNTAIGTYYTANRSATRKLFQGDEGGALLFGQTSIWFSLDDGNIQSIEIGKNELADVEPPLPIPPDPAYAYLQPLWDNWIAATNELVPPYNTYYNLRHGITAQELANLPSTADFQLPAELLNFYKINNVLYDPVTAVFCFIYANWQYDLLPFNSLYEHWQGIQQLQTDGNDYANPRWIPFAEGRNGDYLLFNAVPGDGYGQIIELQNEAWTRVVVATSLADLLQRETDTIKNQPGDRFDFILGKK